MVIYSAGFSEAGEEGMREQAELGAIAAKHGMVIEGPNCLGSTNYVDRVPLSFVETNMLTPPKGAVRNQDGATENTQATPARRGEAISIYGTGPGALSQQPADGGAPGSTPVITTKSTPQVFIGGVEATVQFSGLNPDAPGLWQINTTIPNQAFITGKVAVRVFMDGVDSNEVYIFVQ